MIPPRPTFVTFFHFKAKNTNSIYAKNVLSMNFALLAALWAALTIGSPCSGYPSPVPGPPRRYPVGYDPDNRSRPAMLPIEKEPVDYDSMNTAYWQGYQTTAPPNTPVKPRLSRGTALKLRRSERHFNWSPKNYNTVNYNLAIDRSHHHRRTASTCTQHASHRRYSGAH